MSVGELRPPPSEDSLIGQVVQERYRVLKKIGEGGMGTVYVAQHVFIEKKVALKVLSPDLARRQDLAARFLQEAKSASRIGQENVIDISDFGQTNDGLVYFAMEYLEGGDLGGTIRKDGPLPWARARPIIVQVCKALRAAHAQGIVHRDMKPENIFLVSKEGRADFVKLLDFGIAKVMGGGDDGPKLTRTGMIFGTPEYMAPEQAEGKDADHRVDIYATGCVIYHLITGVTPFQADSFMAMLTKHLLEEPVPPSARRPDLAITADMDALVMKALEKDKAKRWQSMDEFLAAVEACRQEGDQTQSGAQPTTVAPGSSTKQLGGKSSAAIEVIKTSGRESKTAVLARESLEDMAAVEERPTPALAPSRVPLIVAGVALGLAAAVTYVLLSRQPAAMLLPAPVAVPTMAPPVVPPPAAPAAMAPPVPVAPVAPASATDPGAGGGDRKAGARERSKRDRPATWRRVDVTETPESGLPRPTAPPPSKKGLPTPDGLKPFPGLQ